MSSIVLADPTVKETIITSKMNSWIGFYFDTNASNKEFTDISFNT